MLSSATQYLRPEYLSPLPTTLDAKKSPLALLAQTCSNIGADNPNNKPIISGLEKTKDSSNDSKKDKSPLIISDDHSNSKPSFKPYESVIKKDENHCSEYGGKKTPNSKASSPSMTNRVSPAASTGSCGKSSPINSENGRSSSHNANKMESSTSSLASPTTSDVTSTTLCSTQNTLSGLGYGSTSSLGLDLARSDTSKESLGLSAYKALAGLNPLSNCTGCAPIPGHSIYVQSYPCAAQSGLLKGSNYPLTATGLSPYVGYARVKTSTGGTTLVPVCRDPYCTNCQISMHSAQLSSCPSGCTQCNHDRLGSALPGLGHGLVPGLTGSAAAMAAVAAAGRMPGLSYPQSVLPRPNVCRWVMGDTFCDKTFSSSEELLQHLRTHTNLPTSESSLSLMSPAFSLASSSMSAAGHMHYSSPSGLRRTYPTSLSPVSSLSAANRYHPYKPILSSLPGTPIPQLAHPSLGMYYPYGLYGQRLGPPVHP
ncbi:zinc finger protein Noc [Trichonephila inaurata madagascariensis]|uniref:Zinc finger protein Noc n=1 Tax=Trichonephila inaurata madagascariensis TaxID=2747483 RepID=A0A8X6WUH4_9ARAC|nr:zinc finger protein Noc [Trichonephila inaurata madagascariensis]